MAANFSDEHFMQRCIQLARLGMDSVAPNPMVGAILVHDGKIIGEGYHQKYGEAHAEVNCINSVSPKDLPLIAKSTLYVSLEPCSHFGKTPPCADLIVKMRIPVVKIGIIDINQKVHGRGIRKLKAAGIKVTTGICEAECFRLNKRFFTFHSEKRPYIILKWAQSANGKIGEKGKKTAISNIYTNTLVHKWRSREAGILIGHKTAETDNPQLSNRLWTGKNPVKIILSGKNPPAGLRMYSDGKQKTLVFNTDRNGEENGCRFIRVNEENYLQEAMTYMHHAGIQSILVEGGTNTIQNFFNINLWDECRIITNPGMIIPHGISAPELPEMKFVNKERMMNDLIRYYENPTKQK